MHIKLMQGGPAASPLLYPFRIVNLASGHVSIRYGARGPNSATARPAPLQRMPLAISSKSSTRCRGDDDLRRVPKRRYYSMGVGGFASMKALRRAMTIRLRASAPMPGGGFVVGLRCAGF